jgi:hypothetical protein
MSSVSIKNNTANNVAFEARVLTLQGQHVTVRASLLAGVTTTVALPNGVTPEMLASAPEVQAEQAKASPNWSVMSVSADVVGGLSDYETLRVIQSTPASATLLLGCVGRNSKLTKLRVVSAGPSGAGESYTISDILVNGDSVSLPAAQRAAIPASTAHFIDFSTILSGIWTALNEGDVVSVVTTYVAGAGTLGAVIIEVTASKG